MPQRRDHAAVLLYTPTGPDDLNARGILQLTGLAHRGLDPQREAVGDGDLYLRLSAQGPQHAHAAELPFGPADGDGLLRSILPRLAEHFFDRQLAARTKQGVHVRPVQMDMAVGDPNGGGALQPLLLLELLHHHAGDLADNLC